MQQHERSTLPPPDAVSAAHNAKVEDFIRTRIAASGGSISFAEFMQHALYAPGLGYYAAGAIKFGESGDFVTAPEVSTIFGSVLARQCAEVLDGIDDGAVLEYGAGSGKLAADLMLKLEELGALPSRYDIVEVSADLAERQQRYLGERIPDLLPMIRWLRQPPKEHSGVIVANEVLDALPVERFLRTSDGVRQLRVAADDAAFRLVDADAPANLLSALQVIEEQLGERLPGGYVSEVSLGAPGWIADIAAQLQKGVALLWDYGTSRRQYYAAGRSDGWLRCHFRHRAHSDPLILAGIQDLTAWVDFTTVAEAAVAAGLDIAGYATQAEFLLGGGLELELGEFSELPTAAQIELSRQVKMLTLPGEMGEHFKCIALRRGDVPVPSAFRYADRTHTL
jgi:SAM-dependent MidA family methyltransferase